LGLKSILLFVHIFEFFLQNFIFLVFVLILPIGHFDLGVACNVSVDGRLDVILLVQSFVEFLDLDLLFVDHNVEHEHVNVGVVQVCIVVVHAYLT